MHNSCLCLQPCKALMCVCGHVFVVNAERAAEVGREMQKKLDGQSVTSTMEVKFEVQTLSSLRKIPKVNEKKTHAHSGSSSDR